GQIEAAQAIGMSRWKRFRRIALPQLFWYALPGSNNVWQTALKDTALISLVGLVEIMRAAQLGAASTREPLLFYLCAGALFFAIGIGSQAVFSLAERPAGHSLRSAQCHPPTRCHDFFIRAISIHYRDPAQRSTVHAVYWPIQYFLVPIDWRGSGPDARLEPTPAVSFCVVLQHIISWHPFARPAIYFVLWHWHARLCAAFTYPMVAL